jgi:signal transduction histidine kinase
LLREGGMPAEAVADLPALVARMQEGAGTAVIADEALLTADLRPLAGFIDAQEPWSDFPLLILTKGGGGPERNPTAARWAELLGNVSFLERPFHPTTIISLVRAAIRARRRQYEARARLLALGESQARLSRLTATLEQRVEQTLAEQRKAEEALLQAQKIEALGQLTGGVAHDFNNLLMAVMGNLDLLRKQLIDDPRALRLLDGALQGARRGAALTQRMLAFARQQELTTNAVDLGRMMSGMQDLLARALGPQITLHFTLDPDLPSVEVDSTQLELAILNLAINARDAMPAGGQIVFRADFPPSIPETLAPGRYVRLSLADSGSGMDAATLKRAMEPFFSTKPVGKGTGLGLSMVHGMAQQLGGLFELESAAGSGTTATLWLPAATAAAVEAAPEQVQMEAGEAVKPATILMVDDDSLIGMATADMLQDLGHTVIEANSGRMALEILDRGQQIDLMMTDYAMPGMTGVELAAKVRGRLPGLPILLATGYADMPAGQKFDLPRLSKPYAQSALKTAIDRLLRERG